MRRNAEGLLEGPAKIIGAQASKACERGERNLLFQVLLDIGRDDPFLLKHIPRKAERTGDANLRLAVLTRLEYEFGRYIWGEHDNLLKPVLAKPGAAGALRRVEEASREREAAIHDLTSLTPEARQQWDRLEAARWRGYNIAKPAKPDDPKAVVAAVKFNADRKELTRPLVEEYERLDDLSAGISERLNNNQPGQPVTEQDRELLIETTLGRNAVRTRLYNLLMESEKQHQEWIAKGWKGYGE